MRKIILFIIFTIITLYAAAQPGICCLRNADGLLYTEKNIFGFYELVLTKYPTSPPACPRVQLGTRTGNTCRFVLGGPANDEYNYVLYTANGPVQCDIDHYVYLAVAICALFGYKKLREVY
ncbi:MAG: hypothetical protein EOO93_31290 [Pedobacter sp.]|nr:MAG: hypothetical protein EOO93_31290 [Pedobacter sp.]